VALVSVGGDVVIIGVPHERPSTIALPNATVSVGLFGVGKRSVSDDEVVLADLVGVADDDQARVVSVWTGTDVFASGAFSAGVAC